MFVAQLIVTRGGNW